MSRFMLIVLTVFVVVPVLAQEPPTKHPIPDEATQKSAIELVTEVYKSDYEQANTKDQKVALAKKMLQVGIATKNDTIGRYVLLRVSRDIASQQGDVDTAYQTIAEIDRYYDDVDALKMKAVAVADAAKALRSPNEKKKTSLKYLILLRKRLPLTATI